MKKLIKAVLPKAVVCKMVAANNNLQLSAEKKKEFNETALRQGDQKWLNALLADQNIAQVWTQDSAKIRNLYGDKDTMGGVNPGDRRAVYTLIMALKPQKVLEVGTHIGASTLHIAQALKSARNGGHLVTADILDVNDPVNGPWKQLGLPKSPLQYLQELDCADGVTFKIGPCQDYMHKTPEKFDFIFLDGDHRAKAVYQEVSAALPLLNAGGIILLHDYYPSGKPMYKGLEEIAGPYLAMKRVMQENLKIDVLPLGALPWPTKAGGNMTSLALVVRKA